MSVLGGRIAIKSNGKSFEAAGEFKYGGGVDKRVAVMSTNKVVGYTTEPTVPFIEGEIYRLDNPIDDFSSIDNATITLELADGRSFVLYEAWTVNEKGLEIGTKDGKLQIRFEGKRRMEF